MVKFYSIELFDIECKSIFSNDFIITFSISESLFLCIDSDNMTYRYPMSVIGAINLEVR